MKNLKKRLAKARYAFVWISSNISRKTKLKINKSLVLLVLLYGCETWKMNKGDDNFVRT